MKKVFTFLFLGVFVILTACTKTSNLIELPDLTNKDYQESVDILFNLGLTYTFDTVMTNEVDEGTFVKYMEPYQIGDKIDKDIEVIVYFATRNNKLPDLSGKTLSQIMIELNKMNLNVDIMYFETNDIAPGLFSHYGNNLMPGNLVEKNQDIIVYIAIESAVNYPLFISKYIEGSDGNIAVELYNGSNRIINLSKYIIDIYSNGSLTPSITIPLSGELEPNKTFVIASNTSIESVKTIANLITDQMVFNGNDVIALSFDDHRTLDVVGYLGVNQLHINDQTLVRKSTHQYGSKEFSFNEWDIYAKGYTDIIGVYPNLFPISFTYNEEDKDIPFEQPKGMIKVTYSHVYDGDTAYFFPDFLNDKRIRFVGIDTREMNSGDPLAVAARDRLKEILSNAKDIYIQHDPAAGRTDTYGRNLGLVWADGVLVNYIMILEGYTENTYSDIDQHLIFNGVSLFQWMLLAETYARENRLGVWQ